MNFHLPSIPTSLDFLSPWLQQGEPNDPEELRFTELDEDDEAVNTDPCKTIVPLYLLRESQTLTKAFFKG